MNFTICKDRSRKWEAPQKNLAKLMSPSRAKHYTGCTILAEQKYTCCPLHALVENSVIKKKQQQFLWGYSELGVPQKESSIRFFVYTHLLTEPHRDKNLPIIYHCNITHHIISNEFQNEQFSVSHIKI